MDEIELLRQFRDSVASISLAPPKGMNSGQWASKRLREIRSMARTYRDQPATALGATSHVE